MNTYDDPRSEMQQYIDMLPDIDSDIKALKKQIKQCKEDSKKCYLEEILIELQIRRKAVIEVIERKGEN